MSELRLQLDERNWVADEGEALSSLEENFSLRKLQCSAAN